MKHRKLQFKAIVLLSISLICFNLSHSSAQEVEKAKKGSTGTGPIVDNIPTSYREAIKDPFRDISKTTLPTILPPPPPPSEPTVLTWPIYEEREIEWKREREKAREANNIEPSSSERYLIDEVQIVGIYKKDTGAGLFIRPKVGFNRVLFVTRGQKFYNGSIIKIENNRVEFEEKEKLSNNRTRSHTKVVVFVPSK